jgi:thiamine-phosphate pyrophosphorylase
VPNPRDRNLPRLYAIVDVDVCARAGWTPHDLTRAYLAGGARLLQLRGKNLESGALLDIAEAMVEDARAVEAMVIINDRADVAILAGASGVHVGQEDPTPVDVRRVTGPDAILGFSTHTDAQIEAALGEPISYLAIGPIFGTATKATGYEAVGYEAVQRASRRAAPRAMPVVAIGGITLDTAPRIIAAGAASVAVITDLVAGDPERRVREYLTALA